MERFPEYCSRITPAPCPCGWRHCSWWWQQSYRRRCYALSSSISSRLAGLRAQADLRNEKINYKVREHSLAKFPVILVTGTEMEEGSVNMRASEARSRNRELRMRLMRLRMRRRRRLAKARERPEQAFKDGAAMGVETVKQLVEQRRSARRTDSRFARLEGDHRLQSCSEAISVLSSGA